MNTRRLEVMGVEPDTSAYRKTILGKDLFILTLDADIRVLGEKSREL